MPSQQMAVPAMEAANPYRSWCCCASSCLCSCRRPGTRQWGNATAWGDEQLLSGLCPLVREKETKEDGMIRHTPWSLFDPHQPSFMRAHCDATNRCCVSWELVASRHLPIAATATAFPNFRRSVTAPLPPRQGRQLRRPFRSDYFSLLASILRSS